MEVLALLSRCFKELTIPGVAPSIEVKPDHGFLPCAIGRLEMRHCVGSVV